MKRNYFLAVGVLSGMTFFILIGFTMTSVAIFYPLSTNPPRWFFVLHILADVCVSFVFWGVIFKVLQVVNEIRGRMIEVSRLSSNANTSSSTGS